MRPSALKPFFCSVAVLLMVGCTSTAPPPPTAPPTLTPVPVASPPFIPTRPVIHPAETPPPTALKTFHVQISLETYETEETVQLELGRLPGVSSVNVTQLDVTVQYDPARLSEDEILQTLRDNPEVRIKDDTRAGQ